MMGTRIELNRCTKLGGYGVWIAGCLRNSGAGGEQNRAASTEKTAVARVSSRETGRGPTKGGRVLGREGFFRQPGYTPATEFRGDTESHR